MNMTPVYGPFSVQGHLCCKRESGPGLWPALRFTAFSYHVTNATYPSLSAVCHDRSILGRSANGLSHRTATSVNRKSGTIDISVPDNDIAIPKENNSEGSVQTGKITPS
jgi:hypothetical protein